MPKQREWAISLKGFNHRAIAEKRREIAAEVPLAISLKREPDNPHDAAAIAIHLEEKPWKGMHIGYVPKAVAAVLAIKLDLEEIRVDEAWLLEADPEEGSGEILLKTTRCKPKSA
jgi:hypothetical protein